MSRFLGVDGGGTKTAFVLIDGDGAVVAEETGPSCYYLSAGIDLVERVLSDGLAAITRSAGIGADDIDAAFFALPAFGEVAADVPRLEAICGRVLGHDRYTCGNDMVAGWAGSLGAEDGVNVVAGTGSIAYGEWGGRSARAGGWGELFGDEGSGYWTAIQGLGAFSRMVDGRAPDGPLRDAVREAVGAATDLDVIGVVLDGWGGDRTRIAALAKTVTAVAAAGDPAAAGIVRAAGGELAGIAEAVRRRLRVGDGERVPLSYSGGLFADPGVLAAFREALGDGWDLREPRFGPGLGAALYARRQAGARTSG